MFYFNLNKERLELTLITFNNLIFFGYNLFNFHFMSALKLEIFHGFRFANERANENLCVFFLQTKNNFFRFFFRSCTKQK
jgi:hypothetical protein